MKIGDAILTLGLIGLGLFSVYWILQQRQAQQATAATNDAAAINIGELQQAAALTQAESLLQAISPSAPVTSAPAAVAPATTASGQQ